LSGFCSVAINWLTMLATSMLELVLVTPDRVAMVDPLSEFSAICGHARDRASENAVDARVARDGSSVTAGIVDPLIRVNPILFSSAGPCGIAAGTG
jgi:hypothetical protein